MLIYTYQDLSKKKLKEPSCWNAICFIILYIEYYSILGFAPFKRTLFGSVSMYLDVTFETSEPQTVGFADVAPESKYLPELYSLLSFVAVDVTEWLNEVLVPVLRRALFLKSRRATLNAAIGRLEWALTSRRSRVSVKVKVSNSHPWIAEHNCLAL